MALFTDGPACTIDDLIAEDSALLTTAETVGINVTAKLRLAMGEVQSELETWMLKPQQAAPMSAPGVAWLQSPGIAQVVVTPELARWEKMQALSMVYRDAYFSQLVDRYQGKWDEYAKLTRYARDQFVANGIGLVNSPVPRATLPVLGTETVLSVQPGGNFYACIAWVNGAGQEGAASDAASIVVPAGSVMTLMASGAPTNAAGFNVYVGTAPGALTLQNSTALPVGVSFTWIPGLFTSEQAPGTGQKPDYVKPLPRTMLRG